MNVYSEMKMPIGIFSWKYESFSTLALHEKKKKKEMNLCLSASECESVISAICVSKGKGLIK